MLWLVDIPVVRMCNDGVDPVVIVAVSRRSPARTQNKEVNHDRDHPDRRPGRAVQQPRRAADPVGDRRDVLDAAEIFWISTVRPDGRPHVTPLMAVLLDDVAVLLHRPDRAEGAQPRDEPAGRDDDGCQLDERRARPRRRRAMRSASPTSRTLAAAAERYTSKYGWTFEARDGSLHSDDGGEAYLFRVDARTGFGFGKGEEHFSQTRYRFD